MQIGCTGKSAPNLHINLPSPDSRCDHSVSESHGSRLEDVCNLGVNCRVVPSPAKVGRVALITFIRDPCTVHVLEFAGKEDGQPLVVDDVLVRGDGELTCTVEQPLVLIVLFDPSRPVVVELPGPPLMNTVP